MQLSNLALSDVSRETLAKLTAFEDQLRRWNKSINLVSKESLADGFSRHVIDSAQIASLAPDRVETWVDLGSGGGLPGIIVGLIAQEREQIGRLILVESDSRKCAFLRETARKLGLQCEVTTDRIENLAPLKADVVSARALARTSKLCEYGARHISEGGRGLFLKGASHQQEIKEAQTEWHFEICSFPSQTDVSAAVLEIKNIRRR